MWLRDQRHGSMAGLQVQARPCRWRCSTACALMQQHAPPAPSVMLCASAACQQPFPLRAHRTSIACSTAVSARPKRSVPQWPLSGRHLTRRCSAASRARIEGTAARTRGQAWRTRRERRQRICQHKTKWACCRWQCAAAPLAPPGAAILLLRHVAPLPAHLGCPPRRRRGTAAPAACCGASWSG